MRTCYRYAPKCVPTVRDELRNPGGEPSLRPNRLHPVGHHAAQCAHMLRETLPGERFEH